MIEKLPTAWVPREALRQKGQFFTPAGVAQAMIAFVARGADAVFDAGFGLGAFAKAATSLLGEEMPGYSGCDTDESIWERARSQGICDRILQRIERKDFFDIGSLPKGTSIISNPPYVRHHRVSREAKSALQEIAFRNMGYTLDGRAGLHAFFLIHALSLLPKGQRLAFIVPADICEGVYAPKLWNWITRTFCVHAVVSFAPHATPFPGVDTNALVLLLSAEAPTSSYWVARVEQPDTADLRSWIESGLAETDFESLTLQSRTIVEGLANGISRFELSGHNASSRRLGDLVRCVRGVATGANEFFFLTHDEIRAKNLPLRFFVRAVGRTKDVQGRQVGSADLERLDQEGRPTYLLSLGSEPMAALPEPLQEYLRVGENAGLHERALIRTRTLWYKMERREAPDFFFAYLGRRHMRFIRNDAGAIPLTSFLCLYNRYPDRVSREQLHALLDDEGLIAALPFVAKTYGGGAIKLEPRSLERVPIVDLVMSRHPWLREIPTSSDELVLL